MILFFTGTGNSEFIARALAKRLDDDDIVSLNEVIKYKKDKCFESEKPFVVVAPIYAFRLPRVVENTILKSTFTGNNKLYFVATMDSQTGKAGVACSNICDRLGLEFGGFRGVKMPDNYVIMSKMDTPEEAREIIDKAIVEVDDIAAAILCGEMLKKTDRTPFAGLMSGLVNRAFTKNFTSDKKYEVSASCISCGQCEKLCPVNNISMKNGKPVFRGRCIACYSCIHHCPMEAINIGEKTKTHGRYVCPEYDGE